MLNTSSAYKTRIKATEREMRAYLRFNGDDTTILRGVDGLISITHHALLEDEERPSFACAVTSYCEVEFFNEGATGVSLANSYFDAYVGVVLEDTGTAPVGSIEDDTATVEYVPLGRFWISDIDRNELTTKVTAYDAFGRLNKDYVPTVTPNSSGNYLIKDIVNDINTQCSLGLATVTEDLHHVTKLYEGNCRQTLGWVYSASVPHIGCNVVCSRTLPLEFRPVSLINRWGLYDSYTIDDNTIYLGEYAQDSDFTITSVTSGTEENPVSAGSGTGLASENPYFSSGRCTLMLLTLNGKTFTPMQMGFRGDPALEVGDVVKVTYKGTDHRCFIQRITSTFNGGFKQVIDCFGNSEFHYSMSTSPTQARITTISNTIAEMVQSIETASHGIISQILDTDGTWKELVISNNVDLSQATSVWRFNINGLGHSNSYTGGTYNFLLDDQGRLNASMILTGIIADTQGKNSWNLDTGAFVITDGTVNITTSSSSDNKIILTDGSSSTRLSPGALNSIYDDGTARRMQVSGMIGLRYFDSDGALGGLTLGYVYHGGKGFGGVNGSIRTYRSDGTLASDNTPSGLTFTDSGGNTTASYPATGLGKLKGAADTNTNIGAVLAVPYTTATDLGVGTNASISDVCKAWLKYIATVLPNKTGCTFIGSCLVGSYRMMRALVYDTNDLDANDVPKTAVAEHISYQGVMTHFTAVSGTYTVKTVSQS